MTRLLRVSLLPIAGVLLAAALPPLPDPPEALPEPVFESSTLFPLQAQHVHGSTLVVLPGGEVLAAWFQGSGERWADDVAVMGARLAPGADAWSAPFVMADTPAFPDINPVLFVDAQDRLWLMWYTVVANLWETSLLKYRISSAYTGAGAPEWDWQEVLHVKPGGLAERGIQPDDPFVASVARQVESYAAYLAESGGSEDGLARWRDYGGRIVGLARGDDLVRSGRLYAADGSYEDAQLGYAYFRRMGWQTRNKPTFLPSGRMIVPLYSDGFSFSLMAYTDDGGATWGFSEPLVGAGNIQAAVGRRTDGALVAYMRDNGPPPQRLHVSTSTDDGQTWSPVRDSDLPNPGSGADLVVLANGHWVVVYNDTEDGRHSLAVSLSTDEGRTWSATRHLEQDPRPEGATRSHYPAVVQGPGGLLHVTYSYHRNDVEDGLNKTIKYARFDEAWILEGDQ